MFRTLLTVAALGLATASAPIERFPHAATGMWVQGDDGAPLGRITAVERNAFGEIVAVEIPSLEPPDAPQATVAEDASLRELRALMRERATG